MMSDNIVANWLGSLNLDYYTQAFFDNGYDELEICKQIGDADLDAIGVNKPAHRDKIIRAVTKLKEEGGTSVYFTLESTQNISVNSCDGDCLPTDTISTCSSNISYTNSQLLKIIRTRIFNDNIDLSTLPYVKTDGSVCSSSITALAVRYSEELKASVDCVTMALEELQQCLLKGNTELFYSATPVSSSSLASLSSESGSHRYDCRPELPPPIPTVPPPSSSHADKGGSLHSIPTRYSGIRTYDYAIIEGGMCCIPTKVKTDTSNGDSKKSGTLGKLFRNIGIRRSGRKQGFKQHEGDPNAFDITMSDDDRMALMLMVKEGKITTQHAIEVVKRFEDEKRKEIQQFEKDRKKKKGRPVKSPSAVYKDSPKKCGVCQRLIKEDNSPNTLQTCSDPSHRFECFQHRRVHSVSHLSELSSRSLDSPRSLSCTPTRAAASAVTSPVNFYLPNHNSRIYAPVIPHEMKIHGLSECQHGNILKTLACVHDTSSRTSSLSFESEQSMECQGPNHSDLVVLRNDEVAYCSNSSAVSMTSDTSPPSNWAVKSESHSRLKCCPTNTDTTKSASSSESSHSGSIGMRSLHSASPMSGKSSVSMEDSSNLLLSASCPLAVKVHTDFVPGKADTDFLKLEKGDIVIVLNKTTSGLCWGTSNGKTGWFKTSHVEPLDQSPGAIKNATQKNNTRKFKPKTVKDLLHKLGLQHLEEVFVQNGFDHLESFVELDEDDLNALNIRDQQERTKLLTAADFLSDIVVDHIPNTNRYLMYTPPCASPAAEPRSCPSSRDSGCYASWEHIHNKNQFKFQPMHSNKENVFPENFQKNNMIPRIPRTVSSASEKIESNYSEEDKEVFELIRNNLGDDCLNGDSSHKGVDMVTCSYAETQTSPSGSSNHSKTSTDLSNGNSQTPKTFVRKNVPRMGSVVRDAQVQVMSPLGSVKNDQQNSLSDSHRRKLSDNDIASRIPNVAHRRILSDSSNSGTPTNNIPCYDQPKNRINGSVNASPSAAYRHVKKSLINLVASKLASESIDLSQEPYSNQCGVCGIPSLFIQRYSDELKQEITSVAIVLDQIRIHQLQTLRRPVIPAVDIASSCTQACDLDISSIDGFFMSIGLPMYSGILQKQGVMSLEQLLTMSDQTIKEKTSSSSRHVRRISHALDWVQRKISASRDPLSESDSVEDRV